MKTQEFKNKDKKELEKIITEKKEILKNLRFDLASGKVKNIKEIKKARKDVAKIMTVINNPTSNIQKHA